MSLIIGLIITAFVLFFFEIFLPGGVLAVIGGLLLLSASAVAYGELGIIPAVLILVFGLIGALVMFFLEIRFISHTRFGRQLSLQSSISAKLNPRADENLIDKEGVTLTILAPSGKVEIDGKTYTASAQDGYLSKGAAVRVLRTETFKLIVEKL
jgi:membrane-bound serine protease (ClpP class)